MTDLDLRTSLRSRPMQALTWDGMLLELLASWRQRDALRQTEAPIAERLEAFHRHEDARAAMRSFEQRITARRN